MRDRGFAELSFTSLHPVFSLPSFQLHNSKWRMEWAAQKSEGDFQLLVLWFAAFTPHSEPQLSPLLVHVKTGL